MRELSKPERWGLVLGLLVIVAFVSWWIGSSDGAVLGLIENDAAGVLGMLVLALIGVISLLAALLVMATVLRSLGLHNHAHAFALPQGSVRAVLALGLLVVFIALAPYLFRGLSQPVSYPKAAEAVGPSPDELKTFRENFIVVPAGQRKVDDQQVPVYDLIARSTNEAGDDLAKQIFTTIATLLVTVIGFYFGSRTATLGQAGAAAESLALTTAEAAKSGVAVKESQDRLTQALSDLNAAAEAIVLAEHEQKKAKREADAAGGADAAKNAALAAAQDRVQRAQANLAKAEDAARKAKAAHDKAVGQAEAKQAAEPANSGDGNA